MPGCRLRATHSYISGQYGPMENWLWSPSETGQCQKDYKHSPLLFPFNLLLVSSDRSLSQAPRGSNHYIFLISYISKGSTNQVECIFRFGTHYTISGLMWAETLDRDNTSHSRAEVTGKFNLWHFQPDSMSSGLHLSDRQHVFFSQRIECDLSLFFHTWQRWSLKMIEHQNILNEGRDRSGMGRMAG